MSNQELNKAAIKLFKDYNEIKNAFGKNMDEFINKFVEVFFDRDKYTEEEAKIILCKFILLVSEQNIGDVNVSI